MKRDMNQNTMSGQKADIIIDKLAIGKINGIGDQFTGNVVSFPADKF